MLRLAILFAAFLAVQITFALAQAQCRNTGNFQDWLEGFKAEARAKGIAPRIIASALSDVSFDQGVINKDRAQSVFSQSFLQFSDRMIAAYRIQKGTALIAKNKPLFDKIEQQYGVPPYIMVAFWGLETDFGANNGNMNSIRSLATLAFDCRRPEKFREELLDALRILERGDLSLAEMRGPWAGELGQVQFVPTVYYRYGVDFDGDGRRDLIKSTPDVLASAANYLKGLGWRRGEPWLREVQLPEDLPWDQADIAIEHSHAQWTRWGVRLANGKPLPGGDAQASLLLPMGRNGPAFLAYPNFRTFLKWNESLIYSTTAAYFATRLAGAPAISRGKGAVPFGYEEIKELQRLLVRNGYQVGDVDGKLGALTRASVKAVQKKLGLPADSYPNAELMARLRSR
jgi:lytic murein transglycosylase